MHELAICIYNLGSQRIPQLQRAISSVGPTRRAGDDTIRTTVKNTVELNDKSIEPHPK